MEGWVHVGVGRSSYTCAPEISCLTLEPLSPSCGIKRRWPRPREADDGGTCATASHNVGEAEGNAGAALRHPPLNFASELPG
jgi:hypothetical protein